MLNYNLSDLCILGCTSVCTPGKVRTFCKKIRCVGSATCGDDATMEGDEAMLFPAGSFRWKLERLDMEITQKNIGSKLITSLWCVAIAFLLILRPIMVLNFIIIGMVE